MINYDLNRFLEVRDRYSDVASWAAWSPQSDPKRATSGVAELSHFDPINNPEILSVLHARQILVGLNVSRNPGALPWCNFHSPNGRAKDHRLRHALKGTPLWGAYMTDVIKGHIQVDSGKMLAHVKANDELLERNIADLIDEIELVADDTPLLIAMGHTTHDLLQRKLAGRFPIARVRHYSDYSVTKDELRGEIQQWLAAVDVH